MLNLQDFNLHMLATYFSAHPHAASIFTYLIVFVESMAVIGVIVPGAITMPAIGFLIGSAIIPAGKTFLWSVIGALTGDCLSFWIGKYFKNRVHNLWPFTRWPSLLTRAEKFFYHHGGKSVFIGRFVGPTRAMIPMVAGMVKMPFRRFLFSAIPSACVWSFGYMLPGILLGAVSLELPPKVATQFALWALLGIVVAWIIAWLLQHFFKRVWWGFDYCIIRFWNSCRKYPSLNWVEKKLSDPKEPDNHQQLTLLIMAALAFIGFLVVFYQMLISGLLVSFSHSVYYLLISLRTNFFDYFFVILTILGNPKMMLVFWFFIFAWLLSKRSLYVAIHWFAIFGISYGITTFMKFFIYSPRPGEVLYDLHTSSFPSAHVTLSMALYGFLAVIIARELEPAKRKFVYGITGSLVAVIAFSRLYLGAHWTIDVIAGVLLGLSMVLLVTVSYRRRHLLHFEVRKFIPVVIGALLISWIIYGSIGFDKRIERYTLIWPRHEITFKSLINNPVTGMPLYRINRFGRPIEAFNFMYVGNIKKIEQVLLKEGWERREEHIDLRDMIRNFSVNLALFPQLYRNERITLLLIKRFDSNGDLSVLRLWPSHFDLKEDSYPLWIGSVEHHKGVAKPFSLSRFRSKHQFIGDADFLAKYLNKDFRLWEKDYPSEKQPSEMQQLHWDGKLLIAAENKR